VAVGATLLVTVVPARAFCPAPSIRLQFPQRAPGGEPAPIGQHAIYGGNLVVIGRFWGTDCNDTGGGCSHPPMFGDPEKTISLWLTLPGSTRPELEGRPEADRDYGFVFSIPMPDRGDGGRGTVEAISPTYRTSATFEIDQA
jgi:hypothetical protein